MKWIADLKMQNKHPFCWPTQSVTQLLESLTGPSLSLSWLHPVSKFSISPLPHLGLGPQPLCLEFSVIFFFCLGFCLPRHPHPQAPPFLACVRPSLLEEHCPSIWHTCDGVVFLVTLGKVSLHGLCAFLVELVLKNLPASAGDVRDTGTIPGLGRSPRRGHGSPLQYSCLENPMDGEAWRATVHESQRVRHD